MVVKVGSFDEVSKAMDGGDGGMLGDGSTGGADADVVGGCGGSGDGGSGGGGGTGDGGGCYSDAD